MLEGFNKVRLSQEQIMKQIAHKDQIQKNQQYLRFVTCNLYVNNFQMLLLLILKLFLNEITFLKINLPNEFKYDC